MTDGPLISIVMPMHNSEATVEETIGTLLVQSEADFELICVDDESTDSTRTIVSSIAGFDDRIRLVALSKSNAGRARNVGLREAAGRYVIFLDSDDIFDKDMLRDMSYALQRSGSDMAICETDSFSGSIANRKPSLRFRDRFDEGTYNTAVLQDCLFDGFILAIWNKMLNREFVIKNGLTFQEQEVTNDARFTICALASARTISLIPRAHIAYRTGSGTSIQDRSTSYPLAQINAAEEAHLFIKENCELGAGGLKSLRCVLFGMGISSLERSTATKDEFRSTYQRFLTDITEWGLDNIPSGYFSNSKLALKHIGIMHCGADSLYWVNSIRTNARRQTALTKAGLLARMCIAIALSPVFGGRCDG